MFWLYDPDIHACIASESGPDRKSEAVMRWIVAHPNDPRKARAEAVESVYRSIEQAKEDR